MHFSIFHQIPLWLDFVVFLAVLPGALERGYRIGILRGHAWKDDGSPGGTSDLFKSKAGL